VADYVLDAVLRADDESVKKMVHDFETSPTAALDCVLRRRIVAASVPSGPRLDTVPGRFHGATRHKKQKQSKFPASYRTQANVLLTRASRKVKRHPFLFALHFVSTFIVALGVGFIFKNAKKDTGGIQNRMGSLFFILLHLTLMSLSRYGFGRFPNPGTLFGPITLTECSYTLRKTDPFLFQKLAFRFGGKSAFCFCRNARRAFTARGFTFFKRFGSTFSFCESYLRCSSPW